MDQAAYEFGGAEWLAMLRGVFETTVAEGGHANEIEFSMCEVYTDVPVRISAEPTVAWHLRVTGSRLTFIAEEADDVDVKIVGEWALLAELGACEYGASGPPPEALALVSRATAAGRFQFTASPTMRSAPPGFATVHNEVARRTRPASHGFMKESSA
jgi:hypothetical protein